MSVALPAVPRVTLVPGYAVARLISGCWQLADDHRRTGDRLERAEVLDALDARADAGLTSFDCADIYTGVEDLLGALVARRRTAGKKALEIHTKLVPDRAALAGLDHHYLERVVDRSLRRLGVERLDLVQFHWWDFAVPGWLEAMGGLDALRRAGKIRCLGVTNFDAAHLLPVLQAGIPVITNQVQYSLLDRRAEGALASLAARHGVHLLCYGTLAGGFLSRRWLGRAAPVEPFENRSLTKYRLMIEEAGGWEAFQALLAGLDRLAAARGVALEALAIAAVLARPRVAAAIVGVRDGRHTAAHREAAALVLSAAELRALASLRADLRPVPGAVYALERRAGGRHATIMKTDLNRLEPPVGEPAARG